MLLQRLIMPGLVGICGAVCLAAVATGPAHSAGVKMRIGTYDARAIAVAYSPSEFNERELGAKMKELKAAEQRGDRKRVAELKAWGKAHQRRIHRQCFAGAAVDNLLVHVKDGLAQVAEANRVAAITRNTDYVDSAVELVDVTDDIVKLFKPSDKTLRTISELRKHTAVSEEQLEGLDD